VPLRPREPYVHGYRAPSHRGIVTGRAEDTGSVASWAWAAGAVVSTGDDLTRFFAALLAGELPEPTLLARMKALVPAGAYRYGLGLAVYPTPCGPAWGHTGNIAGYVTVVWNTEDASRQLVLMANTYPLSPELETALRRAQVGAFCGRP
jgi:D-alanyl-D-alanine carboxypeptidase